ncbi:CRTAC1 family protein [Fertoeibacter niger]|nr:CRTAC1 family protein [Fertoeibacter niger]
MRQLSPLRAAMLPAPLIAALLLAPLPAFAGDTLTIPAFADDSATSGITSRYEGDWEYMVGGGVATFDCNADGFADLLFAGGSAPATFYRNASTTGGPLAFVPQVAGLELDAVTGAYPLDIDSDGIMDLVLLRVGENVVMRGLGDCRFARANKDWGFDGGDAWSAAFAATWEGGAGWPTLAIGNYIDRQEEAFPWGSCTPNWLHRPGPTGGRFAAPLPLLPSFCALSLLFTDWNRSGTPSLRVSNDREYYKGGQEQMWRIMPGAEPQRYTAEDGWQNLRIWGMGIASYDLNADSYPEYFLTSMADNKLQTLKAPDGSAPAYADVAFPKGVTAHRPYTGGEVVPSTAWHAQFGDVNNDARADLYVVKGNVARMPDFAQRDPNNLLVQRADGTFQETGDVAGVASMLVGRGGAMADFNLDGLVDLVAVNRWEPAQIWRNVTPGAGGWVQMRLDQPGVNRDAIGGWLELRSGDAVQRREITSGGGHASGQAGWWHFGLGAATGAEARVIWPDGVADDWQPVDANAFYVLERGQPARLWQP